MGEGGGIGDVQVDGVVPVGAAEIRRKGQLQDGGMLAEPPDIRLVAGKAGAVNAALLPRPHPNGHSVLDVADRVGLGVLQGDEGKEHIVLRRQGQLPVFGHDVLEHRLVDGQVVVALLKGNAVDTPPLDGGGVVVGVDLYHAVAALALLAEDFQGLRGVVRGDDAVGDLQGQVAGGIGIAGIGEGRPVPKGAEAVRPPGPDVGAGDGGKVPLGHKVHFPLGIGKGAAQGGAGGADVLKGGGGGEAGGLL